jgi:hypothetical protein
MVNIEEVLVPQNILRYRRGVALRGVVITEFDCICNLRSYFN